jgi:integrase/recombinase XerD
MEITSDLVASFAAHLRDLGKKTATVDSYCRDVRNFSLYTKSCAASLLTIDQDFVYGYQRHLDEVLGDKINSIRRGIISLKQFYRFLMNKHLVTFSPFEDYPIPHRLEKLPRILETHHVETLLRKAATTHDPLKASRDTAILALLCYEGVKVTEITALKWSDLLITSQKATLKINGERTRTIYLSPQTTDLLLHYQETLSANPHPNLKKTPLLRMFIAFRGKTKLIPTPHITRHGLKFLIYELGELSQLGKLNTEMLRHYATRHLLKAGKSPAEIMDHFGLRRIGNIAKHLRSRNP